MSWQLKRTWLLFGQTTQERATYYARIGYYWKESITSRKMRKETTKITSIPTSNLWRRNKPWRNKTIHSMHSTIRKWTRIHLKLPTTRVQTKSTTTTLNIKLKMAWYNGNKTLSKKWNLVVNQHIRSGEFQRSRQERTFK